MSGAENGGGAKGFDGAGDQYEGADRGFLSVCQPLQVLQETT